MNDSGHIENVYDLTYGLHVEVELLMRVVELQRQQIEFLRRVISDMDYPEFACPQRGGDSCLIDMPTDVVIENAFSDMVRNREG